MARWAMSRHRLRLQISLSSPWVCYLRAKTTGPAPASVTPSPPPRSSSVSRKALIPRTGPGRAASTRPPTNVACRWYVDAQGQRTGTKTRYADVGFAWGVQFVNDADATSVMDRLLTLIARNGAFRLCAHIVDLGHSQEGVLGQHTLSQLVQLFRKQANPLLYSVGNDRKRKRIKTCRFLIRSRTGLFAGIAVIDGRRIRWGRWLCLVDLGLREKQLRSFERISLATEQIAETVSDIAEQIGARLRFGRFAGLRPDRSNCRRRRGDRLFHRISQCRRGRDQEDSQQRQSSISHAMRPFIVMP